MAKLRPIKRKDLISCLRQLGFTGPYAGGKHEYIAARSTQSMYP
jgi:hypothetical protein